MRPASTAGRSPIPSARCASAPPAPSGNSLFVGIAPRAQVEAWLAGVAHEHVTGANFGPFRSDTTLIEGDQAATPPAAQTFWAASETGTGQRTLLWPSEGGRWTMVVMNADAGPGVVADVSVGAKTGVLLPIGIGIAAGGLVLLAGASVMLFLGLRHQTQREPEAVHAGRPIVPGSYPARLSGHLDPQVSRWMWLVKVILVIPHVLVLAVLWIALMFLTVFAGFAILFTGRYPRSVFDFNVGVMRWTWRVAFYGFSALGTDRYPPFSLRSDPTYPADFDVDYPEHLSRGLVLVKWWLLALPHYLIVAVFAGGLHLAGTGGLIARARRHRRRDPARQRHLPRLPVRLRDGAQPLVLPGPRLRGADARRVPAVPARQRRPRSRDGPRRTVAGADDEQRWCSRRHAAGVPRTDEAGSVSRDGVR